MNLINLKNYLTLMNPNDKHYEIIFRKVPALGNTIFITYACTVIPLSIRIFQNSSRGIILESDENELNVFFDWIPKVLELKHLATKHGNFHTTKVYRVFMKD